MRSELYTKPSEGTFGVLAARLPPATCERTREQCESAQSRSLEEARDVNRAAAGPTRLPSAPELERTPHLLARWSILTAGINTKFSTAVRGRL